MAGEEWSLSAFAMNHGAVPAIRMRDCRGNPFVAEAPSTTPDVRLAYLLLVATALMWAGNVIVGRAVRGDVPPVALSFARWAIAALLLTPLAWRQVWQARRLIVRNGWQLGWLALLGMTLYNIFSYTSVALTEALNAAVIISFMPVLIVLASWLILGLKVSAGQSLGIGVSLSGVLLIAVRGDPAALTAMRFHEGDLWMLGAGVIWGLYNAYYTRRPTGISQLALLTVLVWIGLLGLVPFLFWEQWQGRSVNWSPGALAGMGYVGVFSSTLAYFCWNAGMSVVGPNRAALFLHLIPVFAIILAVTILGERLAWFHLAGVALVFAGLWLTTGSKAFVR